MLNPRLVRNQNHDIFSGRKDRGFALLVMLSLIIIALTTAAVIHLSTNSNQLKQKAATLKTLAQARDAIMAYAVSQAPALTPGTLPCPDTNGDGISDPLVGVCTSVRGLVPYKTLGLTSSLDSNGEPLWYVVAGGYAGTTVGLRNSSLASSLTIFVNAVGANQTMAFIVIAPGAPINGQQPTTAPLSAVTTFLEGENANASLATYDDLQDATHNDQLLGMPVGTFWSNVEGLVLGEVKNEINSYYTKCGVYPWAADFSLAGDNSVNNFYEGWAPIGTALPSNWGASCPPPNAANNAPATPPAWLTTNWTHMIYYAICKQATPANPPTASCINLTGTTGTAKVIVMGPGKPLTGQTRNPGAARTQFYEGTNNSVNDNTFNNIRPTNHTNAANDLITIVAP